MTGKTLCFPLGKVGQWKLFIQSIWISERYVLNREFLVGNRDPSLRFGITEKIMFDRGLLVAIEIPRYVRDFRKS
jgi:hypothetical protein